MEKYLNEAGLNWSVFRPQYITGYGSNKDCEARPPLSFLSRPWFLVFILKAFLPPPSLPPFTSLPPPPPFYFAKRRRQQEWFFDRLVRGRPLPIPGSGMELTSVTHAEDLAAMIASAVGAEANGFSSPSFLAFGLQPSSFG